MTIVHDKKFDTFIIVLIMLSTLRLMIDTFIPSNQKLDNTIFDSLDFVFNFFFYFEFILKCIADGFVLDEGAYLRDNWNKLDFIIVIVSSIDMQSIVGNFTGQIKGAAVSFFKIGSIESSRERTTSFN